MSYSPQGTGELLSPVVPGRTRVGKISQPQKPPGAEEVTTTQMVGEGLGPLQLPLLGRQHKQGPEELGGRGRRRALKLTGNHQPRTGNGFPGTTPSSPSTNGEEPTPAVLLSREEPHPGARPPQLH